MLYIMRTHEGYTTIQAETKEAAIKKAEHYAEKNDIFSFLLADDSGTIFFRYERKIKITKIGI